METWVLGSAEGGAGPSSVPPLALWRGCPQLFHRPELVFGWVGTKPAPLALLFPIHTSWPLCSRGV